MRPKKQFSKATRIRPGLQIDQGNLGFVRELASADEAYIKNIIKNKKPVEQAGLYRFFLFTPGCVCDWRLNSNHRLAGV